MHAHTATYGSRCGHLLPAIRPSMHTISRPYATQSPWPRAPYGDPWSPFRGPMALQAPVHRGAYALACGPYGPAWTSMDQRMVSKTPCPCRPYDAARGFMDPPMGSKSTSLGPPWVPASSSMDTRMDANGPGPWAPWVDPLVTKGTELPCLTPCPRRRMPAQTMPHAPSTCARGFRPWRAAYPETRLRPPCFAS